MKKIIIAFFVTIITIACLVQIPDDVNGAVIAGVIALVFSVLTIKSVEGHVPLILLFGIIFYVNLSAFVLGPLTKGILLGAYQYDLWNSKYNAIGMKCILLSSVIFYFVMRWTNKGVVNRDIKIQEANNPLLAIGCTIVSILICLFSFNGSVSTSEGYTSNNSALFEYAIFVYVLAWYYGKHSKLSMTIWFIGVLFYLITALMAGDRSSAFTLIAVLATIYFRRLGLKYLFLLCFLGILSANAIAQYRVGMQGNLVDFFLVSSLRTVFSDTAAYSYYAGLTVYYFLEHISNGLTIFYGWFISLFTGSLFIDRDTVEMTLLATRLYDNAGGGFFQSYFYAFYGYLGVAIGTLIVAIIISKVYFSWNNNFSILLGLVLPAMSFRWYLYTPTTFFRACLLNFGIMYLVLYIFNLLTKTNRNKVVFKNNRKYIKR